ncbi:eukaryotic translation initiation factor 2C 2 [Karstenula rhodostoma CBS 690.94]|uniref:Eukaryotic translation initiation factor 2C 2 n=1 Tax=Karstenula rhodostoma CBS 690.94 TaxID=1392251 RepID=A0A9P4PH84_9PLEO|nr:eukaryotic translation initiation factor 2C 2 [Karstenula rhodostoma CBS 690.94]
MGGPPRRRAEAEKKGSSSSGNSSGPSREATERSLTKSIPRLDGNRDPLGASTRSEHAVEYSRPQDLKNISEALGYAGWCVARGLEIPGELPRRPGKLNSVGKPVSVTLNTFNVDKFPTQLVYQYDVSWGSGTDATKRVLVKKIWHSKAVKAALGEPENLWIYDGNKLAWSGKKLPRDEFRIEVDLDAEEAQDRAAQGLPPRGARNPDKNKHKLFVKFTRKLDFSSLQSFLNAQASYSTECIDTINFLDHLMREGPSLQYTQIKKSFFQRGEQRFDLGGGVEAFKGVFSSLRPCLNDKLEKGLTVNVDVANGTFWRAQELGRALTQSFNLSAPQFAARFQREQSDWRNSPLKKDLRRFKRVGVSATHVTPHTQYTIEEFTDKDVNQATFTDKDSNTITLREYFYKKYNITLMTGVPVVKMTKKIRQKPVYLPIDVLKIDPNQRYNTKLNDKQTSEMIKFAVTLPQARWAAVMHGVHLLGWQKDRFLNHYGLKINPVPAKVKGTLLPPPKSCFGAKSRQAVVDTKDLLQGRWRLDGRVFALPNTDRPIRGWGVCVIQGRGSVSPDVARKFAQEFVKIYTAHGGVISSHPTHGTTPWIGPGNLADGGEMVNKAYQQTGNRYQQRPTLMFFIVNDRNVEIYRRIKKSMDIRFGIVSQVIQSKHAQTASAQYISNVCMKVNAKLGGATNVAVSQVIPKLNPKAASTPTMVVGADVSHPAPGAGSGEAASFAAITVSNDATFTRYWAEVQTNGHRVEMVTTSNIEEHFGHMAKNWMQRLGKGQPPKRVIYIRDGVSEGQYAAVLNEEVRDMKTVFAKLGCKTSPDFCVMIAGKRHHIRFFPDQGDRNKNPLPGTLVETGCTHPHEFDFYLCSHVAIKGTARPIHYQCILNENGSWQAAEIQQFLFEHSYQYIRSTTPVSLHPAVYYAHLAADRARAHVSDSPVSSGKKEAQGQDARSSTGSSSRLIEVAPLQPMLANTGIRETMWYI